MAATSTSPRTTKIATITLPKSNTSTAKAAATTATTTLATT